MSRPDLIPQVAATLGTATLTAALTTKEVAEHVTEDVGEIRPAATAATHLRIDAGMTVLIVSRALAGIGQYFVGLIGLFELLFRRFIVGIAVRVMLHCQAAIGLLQLRLAGAALDTQNFIKITLGHKFFALLNRLPQTRQRGSKLPRGESS